MCDFINMLPVIGIKLEFIFGSVDVMYVWLGKRAEVGYLIWGYNVIFWLWNMNSILLSAESQYYFC